MADRNPSSGLNHGAIHALGRALVDFGGAALSEKTIVAAKARILHAIGVSLLGRDLPVVTIAARAVCQQEGTCFTFGANKRVDAGGAAFLNGVAGHASLLEDCGPGGLRAGSHPGTYIFPAALAAAELTGASGPQFLEGLVVGYEAACRIGAAAPSSIVARRFRPLGIIGPFGAAAAAAHIFGAGERQMTAALAIAANLAGGSTQGIFEGTMEAFLQAGYAARNGLLAAQLGMAGAETAHFALEGPFGMFETYGGEAGDLDALAAERHGPGICSVGIKRFAACLQNQQTIALIVDGLHEPLPANVIQRVTITRPADGVNGLNSPGVSRCGPFPNRLAAQMSARFTAAAALTGMPVNDPRFFEKHHADPVLEDLTGRIELIEARDDGVSVTAWCSGGQKLRFDAMDSNLLFPDIETVARRFRETSCGIEPIYHQRIIDAVYGLDNLDRFSVLTDLISQSLPRVN